MAIEFAMPDPASPYVFVYGTLKKGGSRHQCIARPGIAFVGTAKTRGRLYSLPGKDYPAAIFAPVSHCVHGELYRISDSSIQECLNRLDMEEGVEEGLYARVLIAVETGETRMSAWAYAYLPPVKGSDEIASGVFPVAESSGGSHLD
jgi:gamma-glutamylcyclotransferase (GGCT)/AIG2-like uncharacterized protein YtfP